MSQVSLITTSAVKRRLSTDADVLAPPQQYATTTLVVLVFLPFVAGYHLTCLFRVINATLAPYFVRDLGLDAADLGVMTAAYFVTFAIAQLPLGIALDRFGARRVQFVLLTVAAIGTYATSCAVTPVEFALARSLIGLGVATSLMAGVKANAIWFPKQWCGLANGIFIALGASGAISATVPVEHLLTVMTWRDLFRCLAVVTLTVALFVLIAVPEHDQKLRSQHRSRRYWRAAITTREFWGLCLVAAFGNGSAFALQGLWMARWLEDVGLLSRPDILKTLTAMGLTTCVASLAIGCLIPIAIHRRYPLQPFLIGTVLVLVFAEFSLAIRHPVSAVVPACVIAATISANVLLFTISREMYPVAALGTINGIINTFQIGGAFAIQAGFGLIVSTWVADPRGHYPPAAYTSALGLLIVLQLGALIFYHWGYRAQETRGRTSRQDVGPWLRSLLSLVTAGVAVCLPTPAIAHSWYPHECCHDRDCFVADTMIADKAGNTIVIAGNKRIAVPRTVPWRDSPDGRIHICIDEHGDSYTVMCLFVPASS